MRLSLRQSQSYCALSLLGFNTTTLVVTNKVNKVNAENITLGY